jgi:glycosyltransferase involved in cell wall biosynthesis
LEIRDIWPESVTAVGAMKRGMALRMVEGVERWAYRTADQVVAVSHAFIPHIAGRGPLRRAVVVVENGVDLDRFSGDTGDDSFRREHGLSGKVVLGYIGTHGMAHGLETVLRAAALTRDEPEIAWLLVGAGAERESLLALRAELALDNVVMLGHQPREEMPRVWSSIDVSLVVLRRSDMFLRVIPSKMFEAMAMTRPILLGVDGEARRIVEAGECGLFVEPEDPQALADAARRLACDPTWRKRLGTSGLRFVRAAYDRRVLADRYLGIIEAVTSGARSSVPKANG